MGSPGATISIEAVGPPQWERVRALRLASLREDPSSFCSLLAEELRLDEDAWVARLQTVNTWIAVRDGVDVGVVTSSTDRDDPEAAQLSGLWVAEGARRLGVAQQLSEVVVARARASGFQRVVLWVASSNVGADRLYAGLGFGQSGRTDTFNQRSSVCTEWELEVLL